MKTQPSCIPCFLRQIDLTARQLDFSRDKRRRLFTVLLKDLAAFDFNQPSVVFGRRIYTFIARLQGKRDIFFQQKIKSEKELLDHMDELENFIDSGKDPLHDAARFACAANAIDFGAGWRPDIKKLLSEIKSAPLRVDDFSRFKNRLGRAKTILFIGDNCGEAFFDLFLLERIKRDFPKLEIYYAVRSGPIINDVTISDAKRIGLDKAAKIISSGCDYPGLIFSKTSKKFRRIYTKADIVLSKGQGNFESFSDPKKEVFYLFKSKCPSVSNYLGLPLDSVLFLHNSRLK